MMDDEVVRRRGWLTREGFLDLLGATNLIPGPNSTEMAMHVGHVRAGWIGLLAAGACFILPAALMVTGLAWVYVRFGRLPETGWLLYGMKPVVIAIIIQALWLFTRTAVKRPVHALIGILAVIALVLGMNEILVLAGGGVVSAMLHAARRGRKPDGGRLAGVLGFPVLTPLAAAAAVAYSLPALFFFFLKVGSILFGSGYVLLAFIRADLVERWGWLTSDQLLDAIAVGQITPGPVSTTATFIGYLLGGPAGAAVATVGMFLPAFVFVGLSRPIIEGIRRSSLAGAGLDGVNVASLGLMAIVTVQLGRSALVDVPTVILTGTALLLLVRWRVNSLLLLLGGAGVGVLSALFR
jgi:chromate transporter